MAAAWMGLATLVAGAPAADAASFPAGGKVGKEVYYIKALHSAKALTVYSLDEGAEIRQYAPGFNADPIAKLQRWRVVDFGDGVESYMLLTSIKNSRGAKVPGCISRSGPFSGDKLIIKQCATDPSQEWAYNQVGPGVHYEIRGVASNFYWHVQNASLADGAPLVQWSGPGGYNARFRWTYSHSLPTYS